MPLEIERKFLVAHDGWRSFVNRRVQICDGIIMRSDRCKTRVRISDNMATIALKGRKIGLTRSEFEYPIPMSDAQELLQTMCGDHVLHKVRHIVVCKGATWQIDVYDGILNGVVIAEIELEREDQILNFPDWVGTEVTFDPRYKKTNMVAQAVAALRDRGSVAGAVTEAMAK